jgi:hypothetical protein
LLDNLWLDLIWIYLWVVVLNNLSLLADKELAEVPWKHMSVLLNWIVKFTVCSQPLVHLSSICSINFAFLEDWESALELVSHEIENLFVSAWLLGHELVAWECQDLEALSLILLIDFSHLCVVLLGQTSVRCHIDHESNLLIFHEVTEFVYFFSFKSFGWDIPEVVVIRLHNVLAFLGYGAED